MYGLCFFLRLFIVIYVHRRYDDTGRLVKDLAATGVSLTLATTQEKGNQKTVEITTTLGKTSSHKVCECGVMR